MSSCSIVANADVVIDDVDVVDDVVRALAVLNVSVAGCRT